MKITVGLDRRLIVEDKDEKEDYGISVSTITNC
jgi:hypothetical protein